MDLDCAPPQPMCHGMRPFTLPLSAVCRDLGLQVTPELDKLRKATVSWMTQGLINKSNEKWYDRNFWMDQSDSLLYTGKAEGLIETKRARMPAFLKCLILIFLVTLRGHLNGWF